ncbi:VOC family protein [Aeromonas veronii]|uniref:VOC family protein n=1 Tax=Aeromonas veronii TaxID=654 RepID=UPI00095438FA|nr:VOC family protein [Aeromonas veronii]SIQ16151.1 methylmalonyl-CoA/ethylmalonyl-CoA epimerase [Aeromonas veronii]
MKLHHIGLVVAELDLGVRYCCETLGLSRFSESVLDPLQRVHICFAYDDAGICYELIAPASDDSPISQALRTRHNLLNHLAYEVADLAMSAEKLRAQRHLPLGPSQPAIAFGGAHVQFFLSPLGHIVELIEAPTP